MPITKSGKRVLSEFKEEYGKEKGERVFYASINKGKPGGEKWRGKDKGAHHHIKERLKKW